MCFAAFSCHLSTFQTEIDAHPLFCNSFRSMMTTLNIIQSSAFDQIKEILVRKPGGKRPRHTGEDNIRMYLKELGWECMDWIHLAQDRDRWLALVNAVMNLHVP